MKWPASGWGTGRGSQPAAAGPISASQARQLAQQAVPGATITETELDHEHGQAVWEIDLSKGSCDYEVKISAATGKILSVHCGTPTGADLADED